MSFSVLLFSEFGRMHIKMFQKLTRSDSLVFKIWTSAKPLLMIKDILQALCLAHINRNVYVCIISSKYSKSFKRYGQFHCFSEFEPRQRLGQSQMTFDSRLGYNLSISICMQSFITIVHSVRSFSLFQNLEC